MEHIEKIPKDWRRTDFKNGTSGYVTAKIEKQDYGYLITRHSGYLSTQKIKFEISCNGYAKATINVYANNRTPYQFTLYFNNELDEITQVEYNKSFV